MVPSNILNVQPFSYDEVTDVTDVTLRVHYAPAAIFEKLHAPN